MHFNNLSLKIHNKNITGSRGIIKIPLDAAPETPVFIGDVERNMYIYIVDNKNDERLAEYENTKIEYRNNKFLMRLADDKKVYSNEIKEALGFGRYKTTIRFFFGGKTLSN